MWLIWFLKVRGTSTTIDSSNEKYHVSFRKSWSKVHYAILGFVLLMLISSAYSVTNNEEAMQAKGTLDFCSFSSISTNQCMAAQNTWDNAINTAWSMAFIGLLIAAGVAIKIDKRDTLSKESALSESE